MSLKKLAAGSGYAYLTEQVAAHDSTELGNLPLADYYALKGEAPGRWTGAGLAGIKGIEAGHFVTAEQMKNLFGDGCDPITGAALGRPYGKKSVAGFDLTFSPVKSVSALWAVAPPEVAAVILASHDAAVADALVFLESHGLFTREGSGGGRQVETRGLIAAAFTHRDSRAGDPDLHTHVAVANKVQTHQGRWLSIYGTVLHRHVVATSEAYNSALEKHLQDKLGVRFIDVPRAEGKRPVREVDGVDPALIRLWSRRRGDIEVRLADLAEVFTHEHGRPPTSKESMALAQRANLETREAKHEPRSEHEQRSAWRAQAEQELGVRGLELMVFDATHPILQRTPLPRPTAEWIDETATGVIAELESHRATWQSWHLYAEVQREVRRVEVSPEHVPVLVRLLADEVTARTINLTPEFDSIAEPAVLRRSDGTSVFRHTGADHFTTEAILAAEQRIVAAAGREANLGLDRIDVELAVMGAEATTDITLNDGQHDLVSALATDPRQVTLALAPAGSGKTTATKVLKETWTSLGHDVVGFAPSAAAAAVLREATGMPTETLAKLDHLISTGHPPASIRAGTMVVIDEAGMADTPRLDRIVVFCVEQGALVRLIGDDQQLASVGAGGVLRDIATTHGAQRLDEVVRFTDFAEAKATMDLRAGDTAPLGFYLDHDRIHPGDEAACLVDVLAAWQAERAAGRDCLMLAPTRDLVGRLNRAARQARLDGTADGLDVTLSDGNRASAGDIILTRRNDRRLGVSPTDWVKNGDRWIITRVGSDGSLRARHARSGLRVLLPGEYVAAHVELGYASTVHTAQGHTADVMHGILTGAEDRQLLYTMLTRGRAENHLHLITDPAETKDEEQFLPGIAEQLTAIETLERIIHRDGAAVSATTERDNHTDPAVQLHDAVRRYSGSLELAATKALGAAADDAFEAAGPGPLPWLAGIPAELRANLTWSTYLTARAERVRQLAERLRENEPPPVLDRYAEVLTNQLREDIAVWRAANGVPADDPGLLGPRVHDLAADRYARHLQRQVDDRYPPRVRRWETAIAEAIDNPDHRDQHTLGLARELDRLEHKGVNATQVLHRAAHLRRPLPEDHKVEALAYRVHALVKRDAAPLPEPSRPAGPRVERSFGL
ncbi:MobF family relaxase [Nocardioides maradonensis]